MPLFRDVIAPTGNLFYCLAPKNLTSVWRASAAISAFWDVGSEG